MLTDDEGHGISAEGQVYVRDEAGSSDPIITINAPNTVKRGLTADISVRYDDLGGPGTLTLFFPPEMTPQLTVPAGAIEGHKVTWVALPSPGGSVKVRVFVEPTAVPGGTLDFAATLRDDQGSGASAEGSVQVRDESGSSDPTITISVPSHIRKGLTTDISLRYEDVTGPGIVTLSLPTVLTPQLTVPTGVVSGNAITWLGLSSSVGSLKARVLVNDAAVPGQTLTIAVNLLDGDQSASDSVLTTVRE
jgi:hypothetical protein